MLVAELAEEETGETIVMEDQETHTTGDVSPDPETILSKGLPTPEQVLEMLADADTRPAQLEVLQLAWSAPGRPIIGDDCSLVLGKLNKAESRSAQLKVLRYAGAKLSTYAALDSVLRPIFLPGPQFNHLCKLVQRAAAGSLRPEGFAELLDQAAGELGRFLSAAQAAELVQSISAPPEDEYAYWHVACARVADRWRLTERDHALAYCTYGWDAEYTLRLAASCGPLAESRQLLRRVLSRMGEGDPDDSHASQVSQYAHAIVERTGGGGASSSS